MQDSQEDFRGGLQELESIAGRVFGRLHALEEEKKMWAKEKDILEMNVKRLVEKNVKLQKMYKELFEFIHVDGEMSKRKHVNKLDFEGKEMEEKRMKKEIAESDKENDKDAKKISPSEKETEDKLEKCKGNHVQPYFETVRGAEREELEGFGCDQCEEVCQHFPQHV